MKHLVFLFASLALLFSNTMASEFNTSESINNLATEEEKKMTLKTGHPDIEVQIKRCIVQGSDAIIDFMITSHTKWEVINFRMEFPQFFDDEGNLYNNKKNRRIYYEIDGDRESEAGYGALREIKNLIVEEDIPRKVRIIVKDVDEYASAFLSMTIPYYGNSNEDLSYSITIKNLPITRE